MGRGIVGVAGLSGLLGIVAARQTVPTTTLSRPAAEFPESYANLGSPRELPDGRVLVIETCERLVKLLDFGSGTATQVSRTGSGPGEYRTPGRLLAFPGDSTVVADGGNNRFLVLDADGKPGRMFPALPAITQSTGRTSFVSGFSASASDRLGGFYSRAPGFSGGPGGVLVIADSVPLERWDPRSGQRDTVAFLSSMTPGPVAPGPFLAYGADFVWAAAPDGRIAVLDPRDYHVEFIGPGGARVRGRPIAYSKLALSEGHKQQWSEDRRLPCPLGTVSGVTADGRTITARAREPEPPRWPAELPPFLSGAARFAPDGLLWVKRTTPADAPPSYDLIDGKGVVAHRVLLAKRSKLLGFGRNSVYVVRLDDDDLQYLQRFPLPAAPPR